MKIESIVLSFLSIFALLCFFATLLIQKFSGKIYRGILLDKDFKKPQSFHKIAVPRAGGLLGIVTFGLFIIFYNLLFKELLADYLILGFFLFLIGFLEDIKINFNPTIRLIFMIITISLFLIFFQINIERIDISFLNTWLQISFFNTLFLLLCFLFLINGANLIDGFNGLLCIHLIIINGVLLFINSSSGQSPINIIISGEIIILVSFLLFNFPKSKMFLGDSGAYFFGGLTALNLIKTNNLNPEISSFFFSILVFYLFYEVFFSFFRKIYLKKSPLKPDNFHLHMNLFKRLKSINFFEDCNYLTSTAINLCFSILILPALFNRYNGVFCKYWFFSLIIFYTIIYLKINIKKIK
tara:strand:+ start:1570 stop:2631 length:1062 start_codon:yes stop_codon:yes gene_type:complete